MSVRKLLTDRTLKALNPADPGTRYEIYDTQLPSFGVRVSADVKKPAGKAGRIAFILYARFGGSPGRRLLGCYRGGSPALTLEAAREKARVWLALIDQGKDPAVIEAQERAETERKAQLAQERGFAAIAEAFIADKVKQERAGDAVARDIRNVFVAAWGSKPIAEITDLDVLAIIKAKKDKGAPEQARNLLGICKRLFGWAIDQRIYDLRASPCDRLRPTKIIGKKKARERALTDDELIAFWRAIRRMPYPAREVYQLLALLGLRRNEVANAHWTEFHRELRAKLHDRKAGEEPIDWSQIDARWKLWTIPAERMKGTNEDARPHAVPLSKAALQILESAPMFEGGKYLFSVSYGRTPARLSDGIKKRLDGYMLEELRELARRRGEDPDEVQLQPWKNHDLRRTLRSGLSSLRIPETVCEAILAHKPTGIKGVYDVHKYSDEKAEALEKWAVHLLAIVEGNPDNVTVLRRAQVLVSPP
jgi:integrase